MKFSAIHTLTLLDFPDKIAAIVFTAGCNFRCHFCHNAEFVIPEYIQKIQAGFIPEEKILNFLKTRIGKLDGIVITGGEPTIYGEDLLGFIQKVKDLGFLVKLDTNGTNPEFLDQALKQNLLDYVAMDIKAPSWAYADIAGVPVDWKFIEKSRDILLSSNIDFELRTTVIKGFHTQEMMEEIFAFCAKAPKYSIQNYRPQKVLNPLWKKFEGFTTEELEEFKETAQKYISHVQVFENMT
jgi:pyruvate formate lyase activating enzyme